MMTRDGQYVNQTAAIRHPESLLMEIAWYPLCGLYYIRGSTHSSTWVKWTSVKENWITAARLLAGLDTTDELRDDSSHLPAP